MGLPLLVAIASEGFPVIWVDSDPRRVESLASGRSYIVDVPDGELERVRSGRFSTTLEVLAAADVIILAVPRSRTRFPTWEWSRKPGGSRRRSSMSGRR